MTKLNRTIIISALLLFAACFFYFDVADTAQENENINVQFTVPGGGGGGGGDSIPPVITGMVTVPGFTTATVSWTVTDDTGIGACYFDYGLTPLYGMSAMPIGLGDFSVNLSGLATGTIYYFLITCLDSSSNPATANGTFLTNSALFQNSLIILAKPEKRVPKTGGNWDVDAAVLFYNPVTHELIHTLNTALSNTGSSTVMDNLLPVGNYEAVLKGQSHLAKKIINVNIINGENATLDFTASSTFYLLAGDVQGTGLKDNFVDILDISAVDVRFNSTNLEADLNRDGIVDVLDMSIVLINYNKPGDPI